MAADKTDNFLKAIKKYAKAQKNAIQGTVKLQKSKRLKEAEETAKRDSEQLIRDNLHDIHKRLSAELAQQTQEGQKKLFIERAKMTDEVFKLASDKLLAFSQSDDYRGKLLENAKAISELFDGSSCVLYIKENDMCFSDEIKEMFSQDSEIKPDKKIKIGGIKGYCKSMGIIADETLDSKLDSQREWFLENATLSVM